MGIAFEGIPTTATIGDLIVSDDYLDRKDPFLTTSTTIINNEDDENPELVYFPHVATKNCKFEVNFGQQDGWNSSFVPDQFVFINDLPIEQRFRGPIAPSTKEHCTVLIMVGLPDVGKTTWVRQYLQEHQNEVWTVLNVESVMSAMKVPNGTLLSTTDRFLTIQVNGVPRRKTHLCRWDMMMGLTAKTLTRLVHLACRRRKNYIIDQTNVSRDTRRKKLLLFHDFQRKCVVLVPNDDDLNQRQFIRGRTEGSGPMPVEAMLEMKAIFSLPNPETEPFDSVVYIELPTGGADGIQQAVELVDRYNRQARPWFHKKHRGGRGSGVGNDNDRNDGRRGIDGSKEKLAIGEKELRKGAGTVHGRQRLDDQSTLRVLPESTPGWASSLISSAWDRPSWSSRLNQGYAGFGDSLPPSLSAATSKKTTATLWAERKSRKDSQLTDES